MKPIIEVKKLSKKYRIGSAQPYYSFRDTLASVAKTPLQLFESKKDKTTEIFENEFWALKDVSFNVVPGEVLGIIGRNGAGKSTLLKILSQITPPTKGEIKLRGRVASLLEVGTGFHPELTGRENIFLNGAILGMTRSEVKRKFEEIVNFAEIEKFLETPVKYYSSGMYMRLAFAVAAHLEPEILIVDEVLAVGDAEFQKKCLGKMGDVAKSGRTILFVSHNMNAIEELCNRCVMLDSGKLVQNNTDVRNVIKKYIYGRSNKVVSVWRNKSRQYDNQWFKPLKFYVGDKAGKLAEMPLSNNSDSWIYIEAEVNELDPALTVGYAVYDEDGTTVFWSYQSDGKGEEVPKMKKGVIKLKGIIPSHFLNEGTYRIELIGGLHNRKWLFEPLKSAPYIFFNIQGGLSDSPYWIGKRPGLVAPILKWEIL